MLSYYSSMEIYKNFGFATNKFVLVLESEKLVAEGTSLKHVSLLVIPRGYELFYLFHE